MGQGLKGICTFKLNLDIAVRVDQADACSIIQPNENECN